jgi:hypothetical protein
LLDDLVDLRGVLRRGSLDQVVEQPDPLVEGRVGLVGEASISSGGESSRSFTICSEATAFPSRTRSARSLNALQ